MRSHRIILRILNERNGRSRAFQAPRDRPLRTVSVKNVTNSLQVRLHLGALDILRMTTDSSAAGSSIRAEICLMMPSTRPISPLTASELTAARLLRVLGGGGRRLHRHDRFLRFRLCCRLYSRHPLQLAAQTSSFAFHCTVACDDLLNSAVNRFRSSCHSFDSSAILFPN